MKTLKWLFELSIIAGFMFGMAYLFLQAWDATEFVDQAKRAARFETMQKIEPQSSYYPKPTDLAEPKVRYFQDTSTKRSVR